MSTYYAFLINLEVIAYSSFDIVAFPYIHQPGLQVVSENSRVKMSSHFANRKIFMRMTKINYNTVKMGISTILLLK